MNNFINKSSLANRKYFYKNPSESHKLKLPYKLYLENF